MGVGGIPPEIFLDPIFSRSEPKNILGKDDFFKLMLTQLQMQDPTDPLKNEDFAAQMAQFSTLETLQNLNDLTELSLIMDQNNSYLSAMNLIGKEVRAYGNDISHVQGDSHELSYVTSADATVTVKIYDEEGDVVKEIEIGDKDAGTHVFTWDGTDDDGFPVDDGNYTYGVEAVNSDGTPVPVSTTFEAEVTGIRFTDGDIIIILGDIEINLADIIEVKQISNDSGGQSNSRTGY